MPQRSNLTCPKCGGDIDDNAPQGLCPKCVFGFVATTVLDVGTPTSGAEVDETTVVAGRPFSSVREIEVHFEDLEVEERIGIGGMGAVYKARQSKLDRTVALKILSRDLASNPAFQERFEREARLLARLNHPNIVTVYEAGRAGPFPYLLMEFVDGENLREVMNRGQLSPENALAMAKDICEPLQFAHEQGVLHRDIKPENILINARGEVKIADFGIAKLVGDTHSERFALTQENAALGSPRYMAPEQFESAGDVDERADVYSLGVVMYESLTGDLPTGRFEPPSSRTPVDPQVDEIVLDALASGRAARIATVGELHARLAQLTEASGNERRPHGNQVATRAAVMTGVSLTLAPIAVAYFLMMLDHNRTNTIRDTTLYMIAAIELVIVGIPAVLGMLFGWRVLAEVRGPSSRKPGFDTALVGALSWPSILAFVLVGGTIWSVADAFGASLPLPLFVMTSLLLGGLLAAKMIQRVFRWSRTAAPILERS